MIFTPFLMCGKFCLGILLDLPVFVAIEIEKWLFETVRVMEGAGACVFSETLVLQALIVNARCEYL